MKTRTEPMKVIVQVSVQVGTSRPTTSGWEATLAPAASSETIKATVREICQLLHDDAQKAAAL